MKVAFIKDGQVVKLLNILDIIAVAKANERKDWDEIQIVEN